jgi:hypothetical protein
MGTNAINTCPECGQPIATADINMPQGVALCRACGKLSKLSEIVEEPAADPSAITQPPAGCSYDATPSGNTVVRATTRSVGTAIGTLAICLFWNGIVSVFLLIVIGGFYSYFIGPLPHAFPMQSPRPAPGHSAMGLGMLIFMSIFLTPFVVIGVGMIWAFLLSVAGRVDVIINGADGIVRTGVGPIRLTKRFDASQVKRVSLGETRYKENGRTKELIEIEAAERIARFGTMLSQERREWMRTVLHIRLVRGGRLAKLSSTGRSPQSLV